jgi:hypothetical protein
MKQRDYANEDLKNFSTEAQLDCLKLEKNTDYIIVAGKYTSMLTKILDFEIGERFKEGQIFPQRKFGLIAAESGRQTIELYRQMSTAGRPPVCLVVASRYNDEYDPLDLCRAIKQINHQKNIQSKLISHSICAEFNQDGLDQGLIDKKIDKTNFSHLSTELMLELALHRLQIQ